MAAGNTGRPVQFRYRGGRLPPRVPEQALGYFARMGFASIFWLLVLAAISAAIWLFFSASSAALSAVCFFALAALAWAGFWSWILRDGLGPKSVTSTGLEAWRRFASDMLYPGGICSLIVIVAVTCFLLRRRRANDVAQ